MIVTPRHGRLRLITQNDHAHFAAELLSLWLADGLPEHPRRQILLFAAREHDNGWREADSAPFCDRETGRPHDFMTLPEEHRREIWQRGVHRFTEGAPRSSLLILRHAQHLHRTRRDDPAWRDVFAEWRALAERLREATGFGAAELDRDYRWIDLSDLISLAACAGWKDGVERYGWSLRVEPAASDGGCDVVRLDPFPLAGTTTFRLPCRYIPERRYGSDSDLAVELARARFRELLLRVEPA